METQTCSVVDELRDYLELWPFGTVIPRRAGEKVDHAEVARIIRGKMLSDEGFRDEMLARPLFVWAILAEQGFGINKFNFVGAIRAVNVFRETADCLFLKLPACHRGCQAVEASGGESRVGSSCNVCGKSFAHALDDEPCAGEADVTGVGAPSRREIEGRIKVRVQVDPGFRSALHSRPLETYAEFATRLCSGTRPAYLDGVSEIRVVEEADDEIHYILPSAEG